MITMKRKMSLEIYKQNSRQNPVTKNKLISDDKQIQETNNTDELNDYSDAERRRWKHP